MLEPNKVVDAGGQQQAKDATDVVGDEATSAVCINVVGAICVGYPRPGTTCVANILTHEAHTIEGTWVLEVDGDGEGGVLVCTEDPDDPDIKDIDEVLGTRVLVTASTRPISALRRIQYSLLFRDE